MKPLPRDDGVSDAIDAAAEAREERDPRRSDRAEDEPMVIYTFISQLH
jgi:hypothetical protein